MGQVQPDGPIDDYFPDYQFGCGWSYSSMTVMHKRSGFGRFFCCFGVGKINGPDIWRFHKGCGLVSLTLANWVGALRLRGKGTLYNAAFGGL